MCWVSGVRARGHRRGGNERRRAKSGPGGHGRGGSTRYTRAVVARLGHGYAVALRTDSGRTDNTRLDNRHTDKPHSNNRGPDLPLGGWPRVRARGHGG